MDNSAFQTSVSAFLQLLRGTHWSQEKYFQLTNLYFSTGLNSTPRKNIPHYSYTPIVSTHFLSLITVFFPVLFISSLPNIQIYYFLKILIHFVQTTLHRNFSFCLLFSQYFVCHIRQMENHYDKENEFTPVLGKSEPVSYGKHMKTFCVSFKNSSYWNIFPILLAILSHNFTCSSVAPVFSVFAEEVHARWSKTYTGCVIGSFDSGNMISSFLIGALLAKYLRGHLYKTLIGATFTSGFIRYSSTVIFTKQ